MIEYQFHAYTATDEGDVARSGPSPWNDRYVGTATLKWPHTTSRAAVFGLND